MLDSIIKAVDKLNYFVKIIIGITVGLMAIIITLQILSRFFFGFSLSWSEELARYLSIYVVFFGAAIAIRAKKLIAVEFLHEIIPSTVSYILKIIVYIICIIFFSILLIKGIEMIGNIKTQKSPALQISMAIPYASIPSAAVLLIINSLTVILELIKGVKKNNGTTI